MFQNGILFEVEMPRVTAQHEQAVRARIVDAAIKVFGETGYQHATVQDVVRESGLSVGAVYTHFKGKEELFLVACACAMEAQKVDLRLRMSEIGSVLDRLRAATDFAIDSVLANANKRSVRVNAWQVAEDSADLRQILRERREEMVGFARMVLQEAVAGSELPGVVKSLVNAAWSLAIIPASSKWIPSSRFWMSEVLVRFSEPTKARTPSAITCLPCM